MDNRSLDEFADAGDGAAGDDETGDGDTPESDVGDGGDDDGEGDVDGEEDVDGNGDADRVELTSVWDPGGGVCGVCGETAERRWRADGEPVCPDCKEW